MTLYKVVSNYVLNKVGVDKTVWHYFNGNLGDVDYSKSNSVKKRSYIKYKCGHIIIYKYTKTAGLNFNTCIPQKIHCETLESVSADAVTIDRRSCSELSVKKVLLKILQNS